MNVKLFMRGLFLMSFLFLSSCGESIIDNRTFATSGSGDGTGRSSETTNQNPTDPTNEENLHESKLNWSGAEFKGNKTLTIYSID